jgi:hypothetical protein
LIFLPTFSTGDAQRTSHVLGSMTGRTRAADLEALRLQRPLVDNALIVVARGEKQDPPTASETRGSERAQTVDVAPRPATQPTLWEAVPEE